MRDNDKLIDEIVEIVENRIYSFEDCNSLILALRARDLREDTRARAEELRARKAGDQLEDVARVHEVEDLFDLDEQLQSIEVVLSEIAESNGRPLSTESDDLGQRRRGVRVEWPRYRQLVEARAGRWMSMERDNLLAQVARLEAEVERLKAEAAAGASQSIPLGREPLTVDPFGEAKARPGSEDRPPVVWVPAGPIFPSRGDK